METPIIITISILLIIFYPFVFSFLYVILSDVQMPNEYRRPKTIGDILTIIFYDEYGINPKFNIHCDILDANKIPFLGCLVAIFFTFGYLCYYIVKVLRKWIKVPLIKGCKNMWNKFLNIKITNNNERRSDVNSSSEK